MNEILGYNKNDNNNNYTTMSIASLGPSTLNNQSNKQFYPQKNNYITNNYNDNNNMKTLLSSSSHLNKHDINDISDIEGAKPYKYRERNYISKGLYIDDIEGTKAKIHDKFLWTKRNVNPLNPTYKLPTAEVAPYEEPKFLRDNISVDDIEGARTKQRSIIPNRDTLFIDDIEGARSGWKPRHMRIRAEAAPHDITMTVAKSKFDLFTDHTQRQTDPLQPSYYINGSYFSDIEKNQPNKPRNGITDSKLLKTDDIEGAQAGYILHHRLSIPEEKRREYRNTNYIEDIIGAHSDTVKHCIQTTRTINPLVPRYQSLDGGNEILLGPIESLVPEYLVDQRSDFKIYGTIRPDKTNNNHNNNHSHNHNHNQQQTLSRQNLLSRSGNNILSPPWTSGNHQDYPLSPSYNSYDDDNNYYTYQYDEKTGDGTVYLNDKSLTKAKSYAEKSFLTSNNQFIGSESKDNINNIPKINTDFHSPLKSKQQHSQSNSKISSIKSPPPQQQQHIGFTSPINTNRSSHQSVSSRRQKEEYDSEVHAVRNL